MASIWTKKTNDELKERVFAALGRNINYEQQNVFGVPASQLDEKVFYRDASFPKDAPFLSTLMENPNHIGCYTLELSELFLNEAGRVYRLKTTYDLRSNTDSGCYRPVRRSVNHE